MLSTREGRKNTFIKITRDHRNALVHGKVFQTGLDRMAGDETFLFFRFLIFFFLR